MKALLANLGQIATSGLMRVSNSVLDLEKWFGQDNSPFTQVATPSTCASGVDALVLYAGAIINFLLVVVVVFSIIFMIFSGLKYINSGGVQQEVQTASQFARDVVLGLAFTFIFLIFLSILFTAFGPDQSQVLIC